jgi:hypothetical protein
VRRGRAFPDPPLSADQKIVLHFPVGEPAGGLLLALAMTWLGIARRLLPGPLARVSPRIRNRFPSAAVPGSRPRPTAP